VDSITIRSRFLRHQSRQDSVLMDMRTVKHEGDLIMAAVICVRAEDVPTSWRATDVGHCLTLTRIGCQVLRLPLMVSDTDSSHRPTSRCRSRRRGRDHRNLRRTTGAHVKTAVAPMHAYLRQPGHIFPLMVKPGGFSPAPATRRPACDLARLSGFSRRDDRRI